MGAQRVVRSWSHTALFLTILVANLAGCVGSGGIQSPAPRRTANNPQICAGGAAAGVASGTASDSATGVAGSTVGATGTQCVAGTIQGPATQGPAGPAAGPTPSGQSPKGPIPALNIGSAGNDQFTITSYGAALATNKSSLASILDAAGASAQEKALVIAMAMQETTTMSPDQRDGHKDNTPSANCSILNVNYDMLSQLGYGANDYCNSINNSANGLQTVVGLLLQGLRKWGIASTLNYQRGGATAFKDGTSYGAADYRNSITTIYNQIAADPTLETDGRRVEVNLQGV